MNADAEVSVSTNDTMDAYASYSMDRKYRYLLAWYPGLSLRDARERVLWVLHNPSTATEEKLDPTLRRCWNFTKRWGYHRMDVVNLYAYRATKPRDLRGVENPVGEGMTNLKTIIDAARYASAIVAGWGANADAAHASNVLMLLPRPVFCLGLTKAGAPRHPLYVRADMELEPYAVGYPAK